MPLSYDCRHKYMKINPPKFTTSRVDHQELPGPNKYDAPPIISGKGYNHIKRAPAYTFGHRYRNLEVPLTNPNSKLSNTPCTSKGMPRIPLGVISELTKPASTKPTPGPGAYTPNYEPVFKNIPSYSMAPCFKPFKEPEDMWTPGPNMYYPPIPGKKVPRYSIGGRGPDMKVQADMPGPTTYDLNLKQVYKKSPQFTIGAALAKKPPPDEPAQKYCHKKFFVHKKTAPAYTFGIRHTPYLGTFPTFEKKMETVKVDV